jgi:hypothetical protein
MCTYFILPNLLISSGDNNFTTPVANFCDHLEGLFSQVSKIFKPNSLLNNLSFSVILGQKEINIKFVGDLRFVRFCDDITLRKMPNA